MSRRSRWAARLAGSGAEALRERDFRLFWLGMVVASFGMQMSSVAIGWQVYAIDRNPLHLGLVGLAEFLPLPILALPAGQLADRLSRRRLYALMLVGDVVVALVLLVVTARGADELWPYLALALATGIASSIGAPAGRALTPSLVPQEVLPSAMALRSMGWQAAVVVGPAVGGLLFTVRPELVYGCAAALSLVGLGCTLAIAERRLEPVEGEAPGLRSVLGGLTLIRRTPVLLGAISLDLFAVLLGGAVALLPVFARDVLHVGPAGLGVLRSAPAVGAVLVAIVLARRPLTRHAGTTLLVVVAAFGASMVAFGLSRAMWLSILALAVGGGADMVSVILRTTIVPLVTPDGLRGRVTAVEMTFVSASNELGAFESGLAAALIGAVPAVVIGGVATIGVAIAWTFLFPQLARVDRLDELRPAEVTA